MSLKNSKRNQILFLVVVTFLLFIIFSLNINFFFTYENIKNIIESISYRMILALGMTFIIAAGAMDLSAGSVFSISGIACAYFLKAGHSVVASIALALCLGCAIGCLNGWIIYITKINFFIITLTMSTILRGIALITTGGRPISNLTPEFLPMGIGRFLSVQIPVWMMLVLIVLSAILLYTTRWGSYVLSLGGNEDALTKAGVSILPYKTSVFAFMGFCAALAGLIMTARLNSAEPNAGIGLELEAITAVIMGGSLISGGSASIIGTILAVFILGMIRNSLTLLGISSDYQHLITGLLLFLSVLMSSSNVYKAKALYKNYKRRKKV